MVCVCQTQGGKGNISSTTRQQMSDPKREEEQNLLGEEWIKSGGGQVLKLG